MHNHTDTRRLTPWIELISDAGDVHARDRLLVECTLAIGGARAAGLWRFVDGAWREVLSRGSADELPGRTAFEALLAGSVPESAIAGTRVFAAETVALALGGVSGDEELLDPIEALLHVFALVDTWSELDALPAALPARAQPTIAVCDEEDRRLRHDLANVLTSVRATEDLLERLGIDLSLEETNHFKTIIEHEASRAGELLATAFVPRSLSRGSCHPGVVLERVLAAEGALNEAAGIRIATFVDSRAAAQPLPLSAADFSRVLQNLVVNAREALQGRKPAHIWITLDEARAGGEHVLLVEDDGPGLEPAHLGRVFEPGFSTKASGSDGRGLSIVRTLIEAAGGSIRARNRSSGGAAFEARFPLGNEPGRR